MHGAADMSWKATELGARAQEYDGPRVPVPVDSRSFRRGDTVHCSICLQIVNPKGLTWHYNKCALDVRDTWGANKQQRHS
eukprot:3355813-Pyramimonas_sp.AAC.1